MFTLMKNTINSGNYKFLDLQQRIARLYAMGNISENELNDLMTMAVEKANPEAERLETLALILTLSGKLDALTARVKALESGGGTDEGDTAEYPAWEPWDGLSNQYQPGAVVSHSGQLWESVYSGQNVWEPGVVGEQFWVKYMPEV